MLPLHDHNTILDISKELFHQPQEQQGQALQLGLSLSSSLVVLTTFRF
jgi:hypothetical protein